MIGSITGIVTIKTDRFVIVDTSGVGYKIFAGTDTLSKLPTPNHSEQNQEKITLFTHTVVREDALDLYGFLDRESLTFFELLTSISGIGPKGALGIMSMGTLETLKKAIATGDIPYLTKVSGIGKKIAERIVIELKDKLEANGYGKHDDNLNHERDVLDALVALGYRENDVREALKEVNNTDDTNTKIKDALRILAGK